MRISFVLKLVALSILLCVILNVIINEEGSFFLIERSDSLTEFKKRIPDPVNIALPENEMPSLSSLFQNLSSIEDEVLYIYQKYLLANWTPKPKLLKMMRREIFRSSSSTQVDQMTLALSNVDNNTILPYFEPNIGPNPKKFKPSAELFKYLPKDATFRKGTLFKKCSVVGNAGLLLHSACGKEIDSADYVFRCNMVPIKKFSEDAGLKTNFTTMNPSIYRTRYNYFKRDSDIEKFNFDLKEYSGNLFLPCLMYTDSAKSCFKKILPAIHNTNGFYLTQTAITLCNEVHLFGFWSFSKAMYPVPRVLQYHFFDDMKQSKAHSFNSEFQLLWQLHVNGIINLHVNDCDG